MKTLVITIDIEIILFHLLCNIQIKTISTEKSAKVHAMPLQTFLLNSLVLPVSAGKPTAVGHRLSSTYRQKVQSLSVCEGLLDFISSLSSL